MRICFQTPKVGGYICMPLYAAKEPWHRPPPPDGPVDRIIREELPLLAAIEGFALALPEGRARATLTEAIAQVAHVYEAEIGEGVSIHLGQPEPVELTPIQLP